MRKLHVTTKLARKMVCDKGASEDDQLVCDTVVCERWCVMCVKAVRDKVEKWRV